MKANAMNSMLYSYMETAIIVREVIDSLYQNGALTEDDLSSQTDTDFLETLVSIAAELEDENQRNGAEYTLEDLREKAEPMIIKAYGKEPKMFTIHRNYWKEVTVEASSYEEAIKQVNNDCLFDTAILMPEETKLSEVNGVPVSRQEVVW